MCIVVRVHKNSLKINRFHSFCTIVVRNNFDGHAHSANASPVLGEAKLKLLHIDCQFYGSQIAAKLKKKHFTVILQC